MDVAHWYAILVGALLLPLAVGLGSLLLRAIRALGADRVLHALSLQRIIWTVGRRYVITWSDIVLGFLFVSVNAVAMGYGVGDGTAFVRRAGVLSTINMAPLFLGARMSPAVSCCGLSLQSWARIHRWLGTMAILQGLIHAAVAASAERPDWRDLRVRWATVAGGLFATIPLVGLLRRRAYETFSGVHHALSVAAAVFAYLHSRQPDFRASPATYSGAAAGLLAFAWVSRLGMVLYL